MYSRRLLSFNEVEKIFNDDDEDAGVTGIMKLPLECVDVLSDEFDIEEYQLRSFKSTRAS